MVASYEWFSPTRITGLTAYTCAMVACAVESVKCRRAGVPFRVFTILTGIQFVLLLDMAFDWRWKIHEFWMREALDLKLYDQRRPPQLLALAALGLILVLGCVLVWRQFRQRPGVSLALTGSLFSVELWCCECLSYHFVDVVLYRTVGKLMAITLVWIGLAAVTCLGAWMDGREIKPI